MMPPTHSQASTPRPRLESTPFYSLSSMLTGISSRCLSSDDQHIVVCPCSSLFMTMLRMCFYLSHSDALTNSLCRRPGPFEIFIRDDLLP